MVAKKQQAKTVQESRPPVVVVLGHVDHGKTTLLDAVRKTKVASRESGGITQHVGASVVTHEGRKIVFLDTPGHEAFSAMRSRGARVADVAILVVAADDGVKPQTREAIAAIHDAGIPLVVALNKIDKGNADPERVKTQLTEAGVLLEGWGGDTPNVEISAKTGVGVDDLLGLVALVADVAELHTNATLPAVGVVIEAHHDARRGSVATLLVKEGTLRRGDILVAGAASGKVKALEDFAGKAVDALGSSMPARILGLDMVPIAGDAFRVVPDETAAFAMASAEASRRAFEQVVAEGAPIAKLSLVLKADVQGSLEAIAGEIVKLKNAYVALHIQGAETGNVTENDVKRAAAVGAIIFAFRVKTPRQVQDMAERSSVRIVASEIIYELLDAIKASALEKIPQRFIRSDVASLKLLGTFRNDPPQQVIGGRIMSGAARKGVQVEVERGGAIIGRGEVLEAQSSHIVVSEVPAGKECGLLVRWKTGGPAAEGDMARLFTEQAEVLNMWGEK